MLGSSLPARLKAIEEAMEAGRLDEARQLLAAPEVRDHARAGELRSRLAEALLARVRSHEAAGRYAEALLDLDRAAEAGAKTDVVATLRDWVRGVAAREQKAEMERRRRLEAARDRIDAGSLVAGREMLADLAADTQAERLQQAADQRERDARRRLDEARQMLDAGRYADASRALERARGLAPHAAELVRLEAEVVRQVIERVRGAMTAGRLDVARDLFTQLGNVGADLVERSECERILDDLQAAAEAIARADWSGAKRTVLRLKTRLPDSSWLVEAAEQLGQIDDLVTAVHAGPLGTTPPVREGPGGPKGRPSRESPAVRLQPPGLDETSMLPRPAASPAPAAAGVPAAGFRLLVDGAGSFLILRQDRVTIGRAGGPDAPADIALQADLSAIHAEIARVDEDYFLFAHKPAMVNGRVVSQRLLEDGDRIELARHVRMTFHLPSRRSASAVLDLGGSQRLSGDVRRVVLFDRHATLGPTTSHHIVVPGSYGTVAVVERAGNLYARPASERGAEQGSGEAAPLTDGVPVEVAGMRIVMRMA